MTWTAIKLFLAPYKLYLAGAVLILVLITGFCGYKAYRDRQENKARQAIAEAVTKGIQSGAREKEIEREIDNISIRVEASDETIRAAKIAVKKAKESKKENVTAEDIARQLDDLDL